MISAVPSITTKEYGGVASSTQKQTFGEKLAVLSFVHDVHAAHRVKTVVAGAAVELGHGGDVGVIQTPPATVVNWCSPKCSYSRYLGARC